MLVLDSFPDFHPVWDPGPLIGATHIQVRPTSMNLI